MPKSNYRYRPNVAAILRSSHGRILVCERLDTPGGWQFPQGGVDEGESFTEAVFREVLEETGIEPSMLQMIEQRGPYRYLFMNGVEKKGFHGQEQQYFLLDFSGPETAIDLGVKHPEFQNFQWIEPHEFRLEWLPNMKREVYRTVLDDFFGIKFTGSKQTY